MSESRKPTTDVSKADASGGVKPVRSIGSPSAETARAADSVPSIGGPFTVLPMRFGRYEVRKELGKGQMGAVYLAYDTELDRLVALKVARVSASGSAKLLKRMEIEAKSAAKVDHPLICKVHDAGEIDGIRFIALQYIEGEDLKQLMKRTGRRREPDEAVRLVLQILGALEAAHDQGVIHRDLKPENVMLNKKQQPVIMDFGLARRTISSSDAGLTQGMIVGTAAYMSPEQATGKAEVIDHRSDLYSVGVMLFEMLTGEWPFTGGAIEVMGKKCVQEPPSPLSFIPSLNPQLAAVCLKMIAKAKEDRYASCAQMIAALDEIDLNVPVAMAREVEFASAPLPFECAQKTPAVPVSFKPTKTERKLRKASPLIRLLQPFANWYRDQPFALKWTMIGATATAAVLLAAVLFFLSGDALVKVEVLADGYEVKFNEAAITITDGTHETKVKPGDYTLHIKSGTSAENPVTQEFDTDHFTLKKGGKSVLIVTLENSEVVAKLNGQVIGLRSPDIVKPDESGADATKSESSNKKLESPKTSTLEKQNVTGIKNGDFTNGFDGWEREGGAENFGLFKLSAEGTMFLTSYGTKKEMTTGRVFQSFIVPKDANMLKFLLSGGAGGQTYISLKHDGKTCQRKSARNDNSPHVVRWDLKPLRGERVTLEIVDESTGPWGFIGVRGFTVTTQSDRPPGSSPQSQDDEDSSSDEAGIARLKQALLNHTWHYRDSLFPPGGEAFRFNENGTFHRWNWNYWAVGPHEVRVHYDRNNKSSATGVLFTFNEDLTKFTSSFKDPNGKNHVITGWRE